MNNLARNLNSTNDPADRQKVLRQDRFEITDDDCTLHIGGRVHRVVNYSTFGIAVASNERIDVDMASATLHCGDVVVGTYQLKKVRDSHDETLKTYISGFEIVDSALSVERMRTIIETRDILATLQQDFSAHIAIPAAFRQKVYEVKEMLEALADTVNALRDPKTFESNAERDEFEKSVVDVVAPFLVHHFRPCYQQLSEVLRNCDKAVITIAYEFFRHQLKHLIYESPFADRSFRKPLGYAGDFEVMNLIYRNENVGNSLFAKCIHRYFVEHPETRAVKNRAAYLQSRIEEAVARSVGDRKVRILSVASGPAVELQRVIESCKGTLENVEFHLLDQDLFSLKHAQRQLLELCRMHGKKPKIRFFHKTIKHIIVNGLEDGQYDMVYSAGLFDYFSDPVAQSAAKQLYKGLAPLGEVVIGNFNAATPNKFFMEAALDWHLIFRSDEDLTRLFGDVGSKFRVDAEAEKVNLFCTISK